MYSGPENMVEVKESRYQELLQKEKLLNALRDAGVDNWEGYSEAWRSLEGK